ncbi:MAG: sugar ABC transporter substrate-binding protein [Gammaproteobacteria bacterium]|nr:sugar ABC transporter substrate-binding protein [Gammaproteobacteria bacterium]
MGLHKLALSNLNLSLLAIIILITAGCNMTGAKNSLSVDQMPASAPEFDYLIGPGDRLNIFVWRNADVSADGIPVMPDGRISSPLVGDMIASGKTPIQLAKNIEEVLSEVIKNPLVTVTVTNYVGGYAQQVRVVGEATTPRALPYNNNMTLLDVMIAVGGLTEFAAGNKAVIVREVNGVETQFNVKLEDLLKGGDISANAKVAPGDIVVIPESLF